MNIHQFHSWNVTPAEAIRIQEHIRERVIRRGSVPHPDLVAGADAAFDIERNRLYAVVVVLRFPDLEPVETVVRASHLSFPYLPGLLSFRETPGLLEALAALRHDPSVIFVDGHGVSHPRAAGIACHLGLLLDRPVIGCAKSVLIGTYKEPGRRRGSSSLLYDDAGHVIGAAVRTRDDVRPMFVSVGHKIGLSQAIQMTLACGKGYRIPEPTRQADLAAERAKRTARVRGAASTSSAL